LTLGTWNTRTLNTEKTDDIGITTTTNAMSLVAGTYYIDVSAATQFSGTTNSVAKNMTNKLRVRNTTDGVTLVDGLSHFIANNDTSGADAEDKDFTQVAHLRGYFTLAGTKNVEIQNWVNNAAAISPAARGGKATSSGETEVYLDVLLYKIG